MLARLKFLYTDRRYRIALILLLLWVVTVSNFGPSASLPTVAAAVFTAVSLDFLINRVFRNLTYFPISGLVSGLLVGLIIDPSSGYLVITGAAAIAVISKHIFALPVTQARKHIFNPAAFGIMAVSLFYGNQAAWWGVAWWPQAYLLLIPTAGYVIYKMGRVPIVASFLAVYFLFRFFLTMDPLGSLLVVVDSTVLLFALVMLPEPQSSPATGIWKYGFGLLVGVLFMSSIFWRGFTPDPLLFSLLAADLISYLANRANPNLEK